MIPTVDTHIVQRCPVCQSEESSVILSQPDTFLEQLDLHQCATCSLTFLSPRLTPESIVLVEETSTVYDFDAAQIAEEISLRSAMVEGLERITKQHGRLLDIGCNRGLLMEGARRRGWHPIGVELSSVAAERARQQFGLEVYETFDPIWELEPFDLVLAWHVLEHTLNPVAFLRQAAAFLKPSGTLALQVPSFDFVEEFKRRGQTGSILCSVHNFYFTEASLRAVIAKVGLIPIWVDNNPESLMLTAMCAKTSPIEAIEAEDLKIPSVPEPATSTQETILWQRLEAMEQTIATKNTHISKLEAMIRRLENGRVMRLLRRFAR